MGYNSSLLTLQVFLWNMDKYTLIRKLEGHHNDVVSCEFSPDGALLATASYDTRVIVWDHHKATILLELGYNMQARPLLPSDALLFGATHYESHAQGS